jgi:hypothetical protein
MVRDDGFDRRQIDYLRHRSLQRAGMIGKNPNYFQTGQQRSKKRNRRQG